MSEVDELLASLEDKQKRLCLRVLSAFLSRVAGVATPGEIFNIVCNDGYRFIHYEQVRMLIANFLVPHGFVSRGCTHERYTTDKGIKLYHRLRSSLKLTAQITSQGPVAQPSTVRNLNNLVNQIGELIKELTQKDRIQVLTEALRKFC